MLSLPIPLRLLLAAQPKLVTPVLQVVHRVITRHLLGQAGLKPEKADGCAVTLIQRFGSAANLNIHLHCLVLDGVYRRSAEGVPVFVEAPAPTDEALQSVLEVVKLVPPPARHAALARDCATMASMFMGVPIAFDAMLHRLQTAEQQLNDGSLLRPT